LHDIIPDIHGQADKLDNLLGQLGWQRRATGWHHAEPNRRILFLGDYIDRGPQNARALRTVRSLVDSGRASALMGNHELNAIHFHTLNPDDGEPLRAHNPKNLRQHAQFLRDFPIGAPETAQAIGWIATLPLYLATEGFRAVHACWNESVIAKLRAVTDHGVLGPEQIMRTADEGDDLYRLVETTCKGPEERLPDGQFFVDKDGTERGEVRVKWWAGGARSWSEIAMCVPDPDALPTGPLPADLRAQTYPSGAKPVFFGHYWLSGALTLQAHNAICLDYSAGKNGPLVAYRQDDGGPLDLANVCGHVVVE
jgi:Calcineurin-like phosphoesterase